VDGLVISKRLNIVSVVLSLVILDTGDDAPVGREGNLTDQVHPKVAEELETTS
jgi:hypothetical protein